MTSQRHNNFNIKQPNYDQNQSISTRTKSGISMPIQQQISHNLSKLITSKKNQLINPDIQYNHPYNRQFFFFFWFNSTKSNLNVETYREELIELRHVNEIYGSRAPIENYIDIYSDSIAWPRPNRLFIMRSVSCDGVNVYIFRYNNIDGGHRAIVLLLCAPSAPTRTNQRSNWAVQSTTTRGIYGIYMYTFLQKYLQEYVRCNGHAQGTEKHLVLSTWYSCRRYTLILFYYFISAFFVCVCVCVDISVHTNTCRRSIIHELIKPSKKKLDRHQFVPV